MIKMSAWLRVMVALAVVALAAAWAPRPAIAAPVSQTFDVVVPAALQTFTVPPNVSTITIRALGGDGGTNVQGNEGGRGADVQGDFAVNPGDQLTILVGYGGEGADNTENVARGGGGGGGGSFVWRGT